MSGTSILHMLEKLDPILDLLVGVAMFMGLKGMNDAKNATPAEKRAVVKQNLPHILGIGRADEAIWMSLRATLTTDEMVGWDKILRKFPPDQRKNLQLNVCNIKTPVGDGKVEFADDDLRVKFLKTTMTQSNNCLTVSDSTKAVRSIRMAGLADEGSLASARRQAKELVVQFLGLNSIEDLNDLNKVTWALDVKRSEIYTPGIIGRLFNI